MDNNKKTCKFIDMEKCSECGYKLHDLIDIDFLMSIYDDIDFEQGDIKFEPYEFNYCPNCGSMVNNE